MAVATQIFYRAICHSIISFYPYPRTGIDLTVLRQALSRYFSVPSGAFRSFRCLIYKVHAASADLIEYIRIEPVCQALFQVFQTFSTLHLYLPFSLTADLDYHILVRLSRTIFVLFKHFSICFIRPPLSQTAWLEYHTAPHLSTPFSSFFDFFYFEHRHLIIICKFQNSVTFLRLLSSHL